MDRRVDGETAGDCQAALLPEDVLADVLRRLAPRDLAASRCVCKAWRAVVDARRLLRAELLPLWVGGIFINFHGYYITELFSRPSASRPTISGKHDYLPGADDDSWSEIIDHCNGLLLAVGYNKELNVLNPATQWCAPLPPLPVVEMDIYGDEYEYDPYEDIYDKYLVYDPIESLHYKVFLIPRLDYEIKPGSFHYDAYMNKLDPVIEQSEWPSSPCILHAFSSKTGKWEERSFVREGDAAGTVADMRVDLPYEQRKAVYWRGALYVHCQTDFVMRISMSNQRYAVINPPAGIKEGYFPRFYLGKSKDGVYCANFFGGYCLQVWILKESCNQIEWVLKHETNLHGFLLKNNIESFVGGPWILQIINCHYARDKKNETMEQVADEKFEWSSGVSTDEDSTWDKDDKATKKDKYCGYLQTLGFHPHKEIVFFSQSITRGLAYHFNSSKVQVLGNLYPAMYGEELPNEEFITSSFPYTPCWL